MHQVTRVAEREWPGLNQAKQYWRNKNQANKPNKCEEQLHSAQPPIYLLVLIISCVINSSGTVDHEQQQGYGVDHWHNLHQEGVQLANSPEHIMVIINKALLSPPAQSPWLCKQVRCAQADVETCLYKA